MAEQHLSWSMWADESRNPLRVRSPWSEGIDRDEVTMRVVIGSDHAGFELKQNVAAWLRQHGYDVLDVGTTGTAPVDYPDYAEAVGTALTDQIADRGILLCGSGVGASIAANKIPGFYARLCH